ncbi:hypothetical protein GCM10010106_24760 [Thermopolyspora flexuosa]|nr:hypothetical protein GCM10010106_24760 [Thermopolyspora flexuosa]
MSVRSTQSATISRGRFCATQNPTTSADSAVTVPSFTTFDASRGGGEDRPPARSPLMTIGAPACQNRTGVRSPANVQATPIAASPPEGHNPVTKGNLAEIHE